MTTCYFGESGLYALSNLPAGTYTVEFKKHEFAPLVQKGVRVGVQAAITVDATLAIGTAIPHVLI